MAQDQIKINGTVIHQPDEGLGYDFETTYTEDSTRVQTGEGHFTPMFTVESLSYEASFLTVSEMSAILQAIVNQKFTLHYFSPYYGSWRNAPFYVGKGSLKIGTLCEDGEFYDNLSFNMIGVDPI